MGFAAAAAPALTKAAPYIAAGTSFFAGRQASAAGKYNEDIANRNAEIKEQEAELIEQQKEFDILKFNQQFEKLEGETKTAILFSGVELSGSGLRIMKQNAEEAELEREIIIYNANIKKQRKFEEANFERMRGQLARQQAKTAALGYYAQAGTSLLSTGGFGSKPQSSTPQTFNLTYANYNPPR